MPNLDLPGSFDGYFERGPKSFVGRMMRCDAQTYLVEDIMHKVDRATMAVGLEARAPFLDPEVVGIAQEVVSAAWAEPGRKPLLRQLLRNRLPANIVDRPKMGFGVPLGDWLRHELRPLVEDCVLARHGAEYDTEVAHGVCRAHLDGKAEDLTRFGASWPSNSGVNAGPMSQEFPPNRWLESDEAACQRRISSATPQPPGNPPTLRS